MKKTALFVLCLYLVLLLLPNRSLAQPLKPVRISALLGGGATVPQAALRSGDLHKIYLNWDTGDGYGLAKIGYNFGVKLKLKPAVLPVAFSASFIYHTFSNDTSFILNPLPGITTPSEKQFKLNGKIYSLSVGLEYYLGNFPVVHPYLGAEASLNFINGKSSTGSGSADVTINGASSSVSSSGSSFEVNINTATRFGAGFGAGLTIQPPMAKFFINLEGKYCFANLVGKSFTATGDGGNTVSLNDGKNPDTPDDHARSVNYISFFVGIGVFIL